VIANFTRQRIDAETPLLSASLPRGERVQIVMPPATTAGSVAITIRRPSEQVWSIEELGRSGIFKSTRRATEALDATEVKLLRQLETEEYEAFMRLAVRSRKNIVVSGRPGPARPPTPRRSFERSER